MLGNLVGGQITSIITSGAPLSPSVWIMPPLHWLHCMKDPNAGISRWVLALQPFKFKVGHRLGAQMVVANFLSHPTGKVWFVAQLQGSSEPAGSGCQGRLVVTAGEHYLIHLLYFRSHRGQRRRAVSRSCQETPKS